MNNRNYQEIYEHMDEGIAFFHVVMNEKNEMEAAIIEDCNSHYLDVSEDYGLSRNKILHRSYFDISPDHDPRWDYYMYQAAVLRKHVHGGFRNRDFGSWMEFSGGPAMEENTCWMMFIDHTKFQDENERLMLERNMDQLTGVRNRNAYEDKLRDYRNSSVSLGVVIVDLNGLKEMNDLQGHQNGDQLIEETAFYLSSFNDKELPYRIGGDEFVLFFEKISEEDLEKTAQKIRNGSSVSLACGAAWREHASDIDQAIKKADEQMYEDKRKYYRNHKRNHVK